MQASAQSTPRERSTWTLTSPAVRSGTNKGSHQSQLIIHNKSKGQLHLNVNILLLSSPVRKYIPKYMKKKSFSIFQEHMMQVTHPWNTHKYICAVGRKHRLTLAEIPTRRRQAEKSYMYLRLAIPLLTTQHISFRTKLASHSGTLAKKMSKMLKICFIQSVLKVKTQFFKADRNYIGKSLGHCMQAPLPHFLRPLHK